MKKNDFLKDLHIGSIIKKIALQQQVTSGQLAEVILCYQKNIGNCAFLSAIRIGEHIQEIATMKMQ